ncbi:MAG TPA: hypothetical protein VIG99_33385 [Myxococcaceae bacterium]|jgi:hypothetical protein
MRTTISRRLTGAAVVAGAAFAIALPARAYNDYATHPELTDAALQKSDLYMDPELLPRLGLSPWQKVLIGSYMRFGSWYEDRGNRGQNHFFDPVLDRGLRVPPWINNASPAYRWALEDAGPLDGQDESLADTRAMLTRALTFNTGSPADSAEQRRRAMVDVFMNLGGTVHLLQDMAQPQHVRNDDHLDKYALFGLNPYFRPSRFEAYALAQHARVQALAQLGSPLYPAIPTFKVPKDFWTNTSNSGIAQYTNQSFVSVRTNFTIDGDQVNTGTYGLPVPLGFQNITVQQLFAGVGESMSPDIQNLCGAQGEDCTVSMYNTAVTTGASTLSIFDQDLRARGGRVVYGDPFSGVVVPTYATERLFSLNNMNYAAALPGLIPQAVSYSAGMINFFFRGKLKVEPPDTGPYAWVDHSAGAGFTVVRAKVTNATTGQKLEGGTIRAIARFHVNGCYQADLSGEFTSDDAGNLVTPCPSYRSNEEHIRVTSVAQAFSYDSGQGQEYTFKFADPIPLSATDLVLQVYYEGKVGDEEKSFALGMADLSEPTFVSVLNATDTFELPAGNGGKFFYWKDIVDNIADPPYSIVDFNGDHAYSVPPDLDVRGGNIAYEIKVDGKKIGSVTVGEGRFARVVVLVKPTTFNLELAANGSWFSGSSSYVMPSKLGQVDPLGTTYYVLSVGKRRNQVLHFDSVTYYHYWLVDNAPLSSMPPSKDPDAAKLVQVQMEPQPQLSPGLRTVAALRDPPAPDLPDLPELRPVPVAPTRAMTKLQVHPNEAGAAAEAR